MIGILGRSSSEGTPRWLVLEFVDDQWRVAIRREEAGDDKETCLPTTDEIQRIINPTTEDGTEFEVAGPRSRRIVRSWIVDDSAIGIWIRSTESEESKGWDIIVPRLFLDESSGGLS